MGALQNPDPIPNRIPALDGVRGLAVLLVVALHLGGLPRSPNPILHALATTITFGWTGVTLFFVLSGFLIIGILWDTRQDPHWLRNFYARRILRIFPLYYFSLLLIVLAAIPNGTLRECLKDLWVYLLYLQNVRPFDLQPAPLPSFFRSGHFWSLAVEEQFYLLWPFLLYRIRTLRHARILCLAVFFASALFRVLYGLLAPDPGLIFDSLPANAGALALGGYLALSFRGPHWNRIHTAAPYAIAVSLIAYLATLTLPGNTASTSKPSIVAGLFVISIFWAGVLARALHPGLTQRLFQAAWLRWAGTISYGVYIYHLLLLRLFEKLTTRLAPHATPPTHSILRLLIGLTLTFLVSWLSFRYLESPLIRLKRHFRPTPVHAKPVANLL